MEKNLFEQIIDLEAISAQLLMLYEGHITDAFTASSEMQALAIDGLRRYLLRVIDELKDIDSNFDLEPRTKGAIA